MGYIDDVTKDFYNYLPSLTKQDDFDQFWERTIQEAKRVPLHPEKVRVDYPGDLVKVYSISYQGMDETPIYGWLVVPIFMKKDKYPCIITYHGFGGSRGHPSQYMHWIMMGLAVLAVDCRDQGGRTGNRANYTHGFSLYVTSKGIHNKEEYYYRSVYMDSLKAIDFACAQDEIDNSRIIVEGGSQGGGIGMVLAALDDRPLLAMVDVPSFSDLVSRVEGNYGAFASVAEYLKQHPEQTDLVMDNLSYFDTMNMADRIRCKVLASVALKDEICPALMYFATYNRIRSEKEIVIYPFNGHEGGGAIHTEVKLAYIKKCFPEWFS